MVELGSIAEKKCFQVDYGWNGLTKFNDKLQFSWISNAIFNQYNRILQGAAIFWIFQE